MKERKKGSRFALEFLCVRTKYSLLMAGFFMYFWKKFMEPGKKQTEEKENVRDQQASENKNIEEAHQQAEEDMQQDADLSIHSPNDDLDEGESARLGEDTSGII